jgi:hypothetical protein
MELTETIESINSQLKDLYGIDTITGQPMWRVVWSEDQFEHRLGTYDDITPAGLYLRTVTEVRWVPKYRQWIHEKYVLEQLVLIPEVSASELPATRMSYENMWTFEDKNENYLPPRLDACKFIIDTVYAAKNKGNLRKYRDPDSTNEEAIENKRIAVDNLIEELFGDQSSLDYTTVTGESIIVPRNYERSK